MEEDNIKKLFDDFNPDLSPDNLFMDRVIRSIEGIDAVKSQIEIYKRRNRLWVLLSGCVGFLSGVIMTLLYPLLSEIFISFSLKIPYLSVGPEETGSIITLILSAGVTVFSIFGTYNILTSFTTFKNNIVRSKTK